MADSPTICTRCRQPIPCGCFIRQAPEQLRLDSMVLYLHHDLEQDDQGLKLTAIDGHQVLVVGHLNMEQENRLLATLLMRKANRVFDKALAATEPTPKLTLVKS